MEATTDNLLNDYQTKRLAKHSEAMERAFKIINGGQKIGLEIPNLDVLGRFRATWGNPENPSGSVVAYAHKDVETSLAVSENRDVLPIGPIFTAFRRDENHEATERLLMVVGKARSNRETQVEIIDRAEAEVLSPADTALELTEEDVEPLEQVAAMYVSLRHEGTLPFLEGVLGERIPNYGHGLERNGTLYVLGNEFGGVKAIRPDGTILPVGQAASDPNEELDGEREEIIRPRLEELREQIETRREEALEEMTPEERKGFYMAEDMEGRKLDPVEYMDS